MSDISSSWLRRLVAEMPATTLLVGGDGQILSASGRARDRFGNVARLEELFVSSADINRLIAEAQREPGRVLGRTVAVHGNHGTLFVTDVHAVATTGDDASVVLWLAAESDASEDRERLVNDIAHALRNAIFAATMQCEALAMRLGGNPDLARSVTFVGQQVQRLDTTLNEMLLYGRPVHVSPRQVDAVALVRELVESCRRGARREPAEITAVLPPEPIEVAWDVDVVRTAVERLLDNAVDFSKAPHWVRCSVSQEDDSVVISVEDRGQGIADDILPRAFEPFYPQHAGRPGLGLAVAAKMARALGGKITLSPAQPSGTVARCRLPVNATACA